MIIMLMIVQIPPGAVLNFGDLLYVRPIGNAYQSYEDNQLPKLPPFSLRSCDDPPLSLLLILRSSLILLILVFVLFPVYY
jgi:hypothetical protein